MNYCEIDRAFGVDLWIAEDALKRGVPLNPVDLLGLRSNISSEKYHAIITLAAIGLASAETLAALIAWRTWADDNPDTPNRMNGPVSKQVDDAIKKATGH